MQKAVLFIFFIYLFTSCSDREVQLPHTTYNEITEIADVSPIYLFYDETKPDSVDFNRSNMISTTNWLVNIDKRLTLKQILPHLQYLQEKRHSDGMHKNENAKNYFTCFNPETENLTFVGFTETIFDNELSKKDSISSKYHEYKENTLIDIYISSPFKAQFYTNSSNGFISSSKEDFAKDFVSLINSNDDSKTIYFEYSHDITFQEYIFFKTLLLEYINEKVKIMKREFIHN